MTTQRRAGYPTTVPCSQRGRTFPYAGAGQLPFSRHRQAKPPTASMRRHPPAKAYGQGYRSCVVPTVLTPTPTLVHFCRPQRRARPVSLDSRAVR